jgi:hypothetical protein
MMEEPFFMERQLLQGSRKVQFHTFAAGESQRMQRAAQQAGTTLNSVLLRDVFLMLRDWRQESRSACDRDILRLTIPVNLRSAADRTMPAANLVSLLCLDRMLSEVHDESALLEYIDATIERSRREHGEWLLPAALRLMQHFPTQLTRVLRRKRFAGTTLLSNIGPALTHCHLPRVAGKLVAGNVTLQQVEFLPVLRVHQGVSFGTTTYGGAITLGMHFDSRRVPREQATLVFQRLVQPRLSHFSACQTRKKGAAKRIGLLLTTAPFPQGTLP